MVALPAREAAPAPAGPVPAGPVPVGLVPVGLPATLLVASLPFLRPGVFGEELALPGLGLALAAAVTALCR